MQARAHDFIRQHKLDASVVATERPLHATELARAAVAEGCDVVVAIGGDGTMNEVATALVDTPATLGLIPCGSGNGLGRHLGIYGSKQKPWDCLLDGKIRVIDAGEIDGRLFFSVAGMGFEAVIADEFSRLTKRGFWSYLKTGMLAYRHYSPESYTIRTKAGTHTIAPFTLAVTNCDQYGNNAYVSPGAMVDDGELDLTAMPSVGLMRSIPLLAQLFTNRLDQNTSVHRQRSKVFEIDRKQSGLIHTDGEPWQAGANLTVKVRPGCLRVMVPAN